MWGEEDYDEEDSGNDDGPHAAVGHDFGEQRQRKIRDAAYKEGFKQGSEETEDLIDSASAEAFNEGLAAGLLAGQALGHASGILSLPSERSALDMAAASSPALQELTAAREDLLRETRRDIFDERTLAAAVVRVDQAAAAMTTVATETFVATADSPAAAAPD